VANNEKAHEYSSNSCAVFDSTLLFYRVAKTHRMHEVAGHFSQKSH